ncbi:MAG: EamA family transporter [bacterium]|nr:EamA family transporter [bacterium]
MKIKPVIIAVLSAAFFGVATPISKSLLQTLSPFQLAGLLYLGAGFGLLPVVLFKNGLSVFSRLKGKNSLKIVGAVLFGGILGPVFLLLGLSVASASSVSLWLNLELAATALLGYLLFKDHLGFKGWLGILGTVGAGILLTFSETGSSGITAGILVALGCVCWGLDNHFTALIDEITPAESTSIKGIFAGAVNLCIGLFVVNIPGLPESVPVFNPGMIGIALVTGFFSYGISIMLYITAAHDLGATRSQVIFASAPFLGVLFSVILLNESVSPFQGGAAGVLILSIFLVLRDSHEHHHNHSHTNHIHLHSHDDDHHTHKHSEGDIKTSHSHAHSHEEIDHSHPHQPDLHHRHEHE